MTPHQDHPGCLFPGTCIHDADHPQEDCITDEMVQWIIKDFIEHINNEPPCCQ